LIAHYNRDAGYTGTVRIYCNTAVSISGTGNCVRVEGDDSAEIKNNIFWRQNNTSPPAKYNNVNFAPGNVDYNIYYCDGDKDIIYYNGSSITLAEWQASAHGAHSLNLDPILNNGYKPNDSNAPPVDEGVSLSDIFTDDIDGISRPQGKAWDIGAYEYYTGSPSPEPEETGVGGGGGGGGCFIFTAGSEPNLWVSLLTAAGCIIMLVMSVIWRKVICY
jgi:hypothetical protein